MNIEKKIIWCFGFCVLILMALTAGYKIYLKTVDTKYAIGFAEAFINNDITAVDKYFSEDTKFVYKGEQKSYGELRDNIKSACERNYYEFSPGGSYGYGNDMFVNNVQTINVKLFGKICGNELGGCDISLKLRKKGMFSFAMEAVKSDEDKFGKLFFFTE